MKTVLQNVFSSRTKHLRASEIRDILKITEGRKVISFAGGLPDPHTFPAEDIKQISSEILDKYDYAPLQYTTTAGVTEFRKAIADFSVSRGIRGISYKNVFVSTGSQESIYILGQLLLDPGDILIIEHPTYLAALNSFRLNYPTFIGITLESDGMNMEELEENLKRLYNEGKRVKFLYTIPTAHNPAGVTMSLEKRKHLIELASKYNFLIIEDDAYGHVVFDGEAPPSIKSLDEENRVIYTSTMSKILSPGLRLGWVVADEDIIKEMEMMKQSVDLHSSTFTQYIALEAIKRGVIQKNLPRIRKMYKEKRDLMLDELEKSFPEGCEWSRPVGGMFIFAKVGDKIDTGKLLAESLERGVAYVPGSGFFYDNSGRNTMRLNFSYPTPDEIKEGIRILGDLIKEKS
ncbi:aminotransferase [Sulfolobales archaeon HS-7]|nr:aminotransferase [Sulfolobales archaeon HS-7]